MSVSIIWFLEVFILFIACHGNFLNISYLSSRIFFWIKKEIHSDHMSRQNFPRDYKKNASLLRFSWLEHFWLCLLKQWGLVARKFTTINLMNSCLVNSVRWHFVRINLEYLWWLFFNNKLNDRSTLGLISIRKISRRYSSWHGNHFLW